MALFGIDFSSLFNKVITWLGPVGKLITQIGETFTHVKNVLASADKLTQSVIDEINGWRNFKQDIRISQRVIQIERAVEKTRALIEGIPETWKSAVDVIKQIKGQIGGAESPVEDAEAAVEDLESGGVKNILEKFPQLAKGLEKLLGFVAIIITALETITKVIDDLQQIVDELKGLRLEVEKLDSIFLSQSNPRKILKLANGKTIKIRVGKLHQLS